MYRAIGKAVSVSRFVSFRRFSRPDHLSFLSFPLLRGTKRVTLKRESHISLYPSSADSSRPSFTNPSIASLALCLLFLDWSGNAAWAVEDKSSGATKTPTAHLSFSASSTAFLVFTFWLSSVAVCEISHLQQHTKRFHLHPHPYQGPHAQA